MVICCKCYCSIFQGKVYTRYIVEQNEQVINCGSKIYKVNSEYEGYVKIINCFILKLEKLFNNITDFTVVIMFDDEKLINDLNSSIAVNMDNTNDNDFSQLYNFIKTKNIKVKQLCDEGNDIPEYKNQSIELLRLKEEELYSNVKILLSIVDNIIGKDEKYYSNKISKLDLMTQDILHFVENRELNSVKKIEYIDSLKKIRQIRRNMKNDREITEQFRSILYRFKSTLNAEIKRKNDSVNISNCEFQEFKKIFSSKQARKSLLNYL